MALKYCRIIPLLLGATFANPAVGADDTQTQSSSSGFETFIGTWTLKDDQFQQVWDGVTVETLTIPNHMTTCVSVTTASSVSCTVKAGDFTGQILWVADESRTKLHHLSHFGETRLGIGEGTIDEDGNLTNRIEFSDEPDGTYRFYEYRWVSPDEYAMMSRQYGADDELTGNWYGGTFMRVVE